MEDWESEDFEPVAPIAKKEPLKSQWDDEDVEEEDVKESWEDEDDSSEKPKPQPAPKPTVKSQGKKAKAAELKVSEPKSTAVDREVLSDPLAEKLRQQRLVEEADYKSTTDLFGKRGDEKTLDNFIPKSEADFMEYAELLSHKIRPYDKSYHFVGLLKAVMRLSMVNMKAADAKEVASSISALANEKLKAEKEAAAGKKKGAKKKQLLVDTANDDMAIGGAYEALDDYDFM